MSFSFGKGPLFAGRDIQMILYSPTSLLQVILSKSLLLAPFLFLVNSLARDL